MSMDWLRWYHGTVNDPKWRVISRRAKSSIPVVLAVWSAMLENASQASPRGTLQGWSHEDVGAALDLDASEVEAVYSAMQGKTLEGDVLTGWDKRQPKREREESSAERVRAFRERQKEQAQEPEETPVTPCNASDNHETPRLDKSREEEISPDRSPRESESSGNARAGFRTPIPADFQVTEQHRQYAGMHRLPNPDDCILAFVNHHQAKGTLSANWDAEFRKWLATQKVLDAKRPRAGPSPSTGKQAARENFARQMANGRTGTTERVIDGTAERVD